MAKKLHIKTYGCQMNVYDSARMADVLAPLGFATTEDVECADMVILNTCHIREKATEKVFSELGRLRHLKSQKEREGGYMILAVAGCVAQAEGDEILRRMPCVDMVFGPQTYHNLPRMVARLSRAAGAVLDTDFPPEPKFDRLPERASIEGSAAFLTVQEGCDKFCTFCVVPYVRGAEYSRPVGQVLDEAQRLVALGARELTLLGQNVNNYHGRMPDRGEWGLGRLIAALAEIDGLSRIRYTTSYPADMDDSLIAAHRDVPQLMPFLHLPVQSGSDRVLAAMGRRHRNDDYRRLVDRLEARTARHRALVRFHRRISRRDGDRLPGELGSGRGHRLHPGLFVQVQSPPGHAGGTHGEPGPRRRQGRAAGPAACAAGRSAAVLQPPLRRPRHAGSLRPSGAERRPAGGP